MNKEKQLQARSLLQQLFSNRTTSEQQTKSSLGLPMTTVFSNPRVATLARPLKGGREEWIIVPTTPVHGFTALHEVDQSGAVPSVVEQITIETAWELEVFRTDLVTRGWS
jgi:hypothetical protein